MNKLLALDLSTTTVGYCYTGPDGKAVYGRICDDQEGDFFRSLYISQEIVSLAKKINPDRIVKEELNFSRNLRTVKAICRCEGQILARLWDAGYRMDSIGSSQYRSASGFPYKSFAKGEKLKARVKLWIESLGYTPADDNESDAICLWLGVLKGGL
jgi:hypothetical protein